MEERMPHPFISDPTERYVEALKWEHFVFHLNPSISLHSCLLTLSDSQNRKKEVLS